MRISKTILLISALATGVLFIAAVQNAGGPPAGRTGAPGEITCTECHTGTVNSGSGSITVKVGDNLTNYAPGATYDVSVTVAEGVINKFGFEVTALDETGANAGTLQVTDNTNTQPTSATVQGKSRRYIEHRLAGTSTSKPGTKFWSFKWQAPATDIGPVTFYAAGVAANNNARETGDHVYKTSLTLEPATAGPMASLDVASDALFCARGDYSIFYSVSEAFDAGNTFTVQYSPDAKAANVQTIGSAQGTVEGVIGVTMPMDVVPSQKGFLRIVASAPAFESEFVPAKFGNVPVPTIDKVGEELHAVPGTGNFTYQWFRDAQEINGATQPVYVPTADGNYTVEIKGAIGCAATSEPFSYTSVASAEGLTALQVFPNPTADVVRVEATLPASGAVSLEVIGLDGRLVYSRNWSRTQGAFTHDVPTGAWAAGTYVVRLTAAARTWSQRVLVR